MIGIEEFMSATEERIPTATELLGICDSLNIKFAIKEGKPVMQACPECMSEAQTLAMLFRREPFRTEAIKAKLSSEIPPIPAAKEPEPKDEVAKLPGPVIPPGAVIVVADDKGYTDKAMRGPAYMWTWIPDAPTWYYVRHHALPPGYGSKEASDGTGKDTQHDSVQGRVDLHQGRLECNSSAG